MIRRVLRLKFKVAVSLNDLRSGTKKIVSKARRYNNKQRTPNNEQQTTNKLNKNINIHNYEEFLIDFIDGTLNDEEHAAVVMFLENHPNIADEFSGIADFNLDFCNIEFSAKESLKKSFDINLENYEHYFIAAAEGDLSSDELIQLEEFIEQNPTLEKEYKIFQNLQLSLVEELPELELNSIKKIELSNGEFISELDFEKMCIAYFENDLSDDKIALVDASIEASKTAEVIFNNYSKLKLKANLDIIMPDKSNLKKRVFLPFIGKKAIYIPAVAASIAFLIIYYIYPNTYGVKDVNNSAINDVFKPIKSELVVSKQIANDSIDELDNDSEIAITYAKGSNNKITRSSSIDRNIVNKVSLHKRRIKSLVPDNVKTIACCENIGPDKDVIIGKMKFEMVPPELAYNAVDSGYFLVVAPPNKSIIAKFIPKGMKKVGKRLNKVFSERRAAIESEKAMTTLENIAQVAIIGFNKMTESDYSFKRNNSSDNVDDKATK